MKSGEQMKKTILTLTLLLTFTSFANCLPVYQAKIGKLDRILFPARATAVGSAIMTAGSQTVLIVAGAASTTALAASGAGIAAIGLTYGAYAIRQRQFNKMVKLINESAHGDGKHLRILQKQLSKKLETYFSTQELANLILEQNESDMLCEYDVDKGLQIPMTYKNFKKYILAI